MMVGFVPEKEELPKFAYGTAGAVSGMVTRAVAQPLDVLKIRFQVHVLPISHNEPNSKYRSVIHAVKCIYSEEGYKAFWKGHVSAQALSVIYGVVQFTTFEYLTKEVWFHLPKKFTSDYRALTHFMCGGIAGSVATLACQPCDVLRTRFVTQGNKKVYTSIRHACVKMMNEEGYRAFYKGLIPTLIQVTPNTALQFGIYTMLNGTWKRFFQPDKDQHTIGRLESLVCGSGSGFLSKLIIYPMDMTKKRLQVQGFEQGWSSIGETRHYTGFVNCFKSVFKEEGIRGLYKGLSPSLLKAIVVSAVQFFTYEETVKVLKMVYF